ncbi:hypothetical protein QJQ45_002877 [Haematococcus lacustris]|nr:hypothetical protein QJQ45_002877 [Haematococcus lacustris]
MWAEVSKPRWANAKFRLYCGKKRVVAGFQSKLIKQAKQRWPDRVLALAYGAAGFSGSGSVGCRGVPVSQMLKEALRQLPAGSRIHDVFHVSLVKPYRTYDASNQWLDGEQEYQVEKVVDYQLAKSQGKRGGKPKKRQWEFLVKWQGHGDEHNTWECRSQLVGCQELLTAYLQKLGLEADMVEVEAVG